MDCGFVFAALSGNKMLPNAIATCIVMQICTA